MRSYQAVAALASTVHLEEQNTAKKRGSEPLPLSGIMKMLTSTYCRPFTRFGLAASVP
jgi:hypothetical protein